MAKLLIENPALLVEWSTVRLGDELPRRPERISCLNILSIGLAKVGRAHSTARSQRQFRKDVTCNTFPSEAYDLDGAETFELPQQRLECSSIGDLLLDALFIIVMDLGGYKEVSEWPAMPATETSSSPTFTFLAVPLDP